ncbi:MAG: mechanosensitive ion channel domain-containing protein [Bacteroidota bacterium]
MIENISEWIKSFQWLHNDMKFIIIIILSFAAYILLNRVILRLIRKFIKSTKNQVDDIFFTSKVLRRISYLAPLAVIANYTYLLPDIKIFLDRLIASLAILTFVLTTSAILSAVSEYYQKTEKFKERPIKGYIEVLIIIIYVFGFILVLGTLVGESPWAILTGLGALTAILLLVFRDTILSFAASIQISSYDLVKIGDWVEVPKYGADGDVIDISLNVIKIQNWDKTITVIPTYKLIEDSFKNWRGMTLSGGRRIKRSVFIDQSSIKFCTEEMLNKYEKFSLITYYIKQKREEIKLYNQQKNYDDNILVNGRRLTNIGTFRAYLTEYLKQREDIRKDLTFMVRQLHPGSEGLPIEIYVFSNTTEWTVYESIQSDLFDHILAVIPQFDLRIFQNPTGSDFRKITSD